MVITLDKKEFSDAVARVARFAQRQSGSLPALSGIAVIAGDDGVKLRATNLETGIDLRVAGTIQEAGVVALPATTLREITNSLGGSGTLTLEHSGDTVLITSQTSRSTLKTLPYDDFPTIPFPEAPTSKFSLPGSTIRALVTTVASCASPSTVRPELASVLLQAEGGVLKSVATDSFRLAEKKVTITGTVPPFSILIPAKNALDVVATIPDEQVEVLVDDHQCAFSWKDGIITTRLVNVPYPDYTQIIPKSFVAEATVLRKDFETALRRAAVFSDTFQKVRLTYATNEKKLIFSARNADVGDSSESVPAALTGDAIELSFNHRYLAAPLSMIAQESMTISASGIGRAAVMRGVGDTGFLYLVMPMNQ